MEVGGRGGGGAGREGAVAQGGYRTGSIRQVTKDGYRGDRGALTATAGGQARRCLRACSWETAVDGEGRFRGDRAP